METLDMTPKFEAILKILFLTGGDVVACDLATLSREECHTLLALAYIRLDDASAIVDNMETPQDAYEEAYHALWCLCNLTDALEKTLNTKETR